MRSCRNLQWLLGCFKGFLFFFQQFGLRTSDIVVGNGSCLAHVEKSALWFDDLSACGMKRISIDRFNINVRHER